MPAGLAGVGREPSLRMLGWPVLREVTIGEIQRIFEITDRMGIHRESLVIPLAPRHPGRVRRMPGGKIEIVVDSEAELAAWLSNLEAEIQKVLA